MKESLMIRDLISLWIEYADKRSDHSLSSFSSWLYKKVHQPEEAPDVSEEEMHEKKMELGHVFGRLCNFSQLWGKLAFKDLPIRQFEDFGILSGVKGMKRPSKNDLVNLLVIEKSTVFEIIKRLTRNGLLKEEIDSEDKRVRRVMLTPYGHSIVEIAEQQAGKVAELLVGDATNNEVLSLLESFHKLNHFHSGIYEADAYKKIDDLL